MVKPRRPCTLARTVTKSLSVFSSAPARDLRAASSTLRRWCSPDSRSAAYTASTWEETLQGQCGRLSLHADSRMLAPTPEGRHPGETTRRIPERWRAAGGLLSERPCSDPQTPSHTLPAASLTCQIPSTPRLQSCLLCWVFQAMKAISSSHPAMTSNKRRKTIGEASRCEKEEGRARAQKRASAARPPSAGALWPQGQSSPPSVTPG